MELSLIISVYNDYPALQCVLNSLVLQSHKNFEIIIAHDSNDVTIHSLIQKYQSALQIKVVQQEDLGFRKNEILNKSIEQTSFDKIVFIDGDCMLHKHFIRNYERCIVKGRCCAGRRLDVDSKTASLLRSNSIQKANLFHFIKNKTKRIEELLYAPCFPQSLLSKPKLLGCNMGWHKLDLIALNGFDEDYQNPGYGEDVDIEWRAVKLGILPYSMRFKAIQFHLEHARPNRKEIVEKAKDMIDQKIMIGMARCQNGLSK
jgi:glycosyltransferase involved in cell wall biosynthesis